MNRRYGHKRAMREAEENMETFRRFFDDAELELMFDERKIVLDAEEDELGDECYGEEER